MKFCSLYSGSSGNSIFVASDNGKILIDAGLPGKKIDEALKSIGEDAAKIDGIFITHEHSDHIKGVGVLSRKYDIPIFANEATWINMKDSLGKIKEHNVKILNKRSSIQVKDLDIRCFNIPHDAAGPMGYTVSTQKKQVSVVTDFGIFTEEIKKNIKDSDFILMESNHDVQMLKFGPYPYPLKRRILSEIGHLSNEDCGKAIIDIIKEGKANEFLLGHLSGTNNHSDLAYETVISVLRENKIEVGVDVKVSMAKRGEPSGYKIL